ncbi:hypothetical protein J8273_1341 [Carpediemonas membranifera]|uniref:Uncharacterized protein n=1 Tax=Carpediemonas membranifera TaxID=201153 RepID=A0A8J6BBT7_9EUKA|nr:hypothetical protein J8273_1341 [Carpediemonas membranifera]|eukprot:KAG9396992.1 hypothetical protein J8273_1341 [Carpediemonas membranifera]
MSLSTSLESFSPQHSDGEDKTPEETNLGPPFGDHLERPRSLSLRNLKKPRQETSREIQVPIYAVSSAENLLRALEHAESGSDHHGPQTDRSDSAQPGQQWRLILGDFTVIPAFIVSFLLAAALFVSLIVVLPAPAFADWFDTCSGYIALLGVFMSIYSSDTPDLSVAYRPNVLWGSFRLFVAIGGGILYTLFLKALHRFFFNISDSDAIYRGLLGMMPMHFIMASFDLDLFNGFFFRQLHVPFNFIPPLALAIAIEVFIHVYIISPGLEDPNVFQLRASIANTFHIIYLLAMVLCGPFTHNIVDSAIRGHGAVRKGLVILGGITVVAVVVHLIMYLILCEVLPDSYGWADTGYVLRMIITGFFPAVVFMSYSVREETRLSSSLTVSVTLALTVGMGVLQLALYYSTVNPLVRWIRSDTGPWYMSDTITWSFLLGTVFHCWATMFNYAGLGRPVGKEEAI